MKREIEEVIGLDCSHAILASAKQGIGIQEILEEVVRRVPPPKDNRGEALRALIFDSYYDAYKVRGWRVVWWVVWWVGGCGRGGQASNGGAPQWGMAVCCLSLMPPSLALLTVNSTISASPHVSLLCPACPPACLHACLPACLLACLACRGWWCNSASWTARCARATSSSL